MLDICDDGQSACGDSCAANGLDSKGITPCCDAISWSFWLMMMATLPLCDSDATFVEGMYCDDKVGVSEECDVGNLANGEDVHLLLVNINYLRRRSFIHMHQ